MCHCSQLGEAGSDRSAMKSGRYSGLGTVADRWNVKGVEGGGVVDKCVQSVGVALRVCNTAADVRQGSSARMTSKRAQRAQNMERILVTQRMVIEAAMHQCLRITMHRTRLTTHVVKQNGSATRVSKEWTSWVPP